MTLAHYIQQIATPGSGWLSEPDAHDLLAVLLDGGASDMEVGAVLMGLRMRCTSMSELTGFERALAERTYGLRLPSPSPKPLVFATYHGVRDEPNLLPLLALMLRRLGVPVLLHGAMDGGGAVASVYVLRKLGIMPSATLAQAQIALEEEGLAFVPTAVLCPAMASLLALRHRLGTRNIAHTLVNLIDPFHGESVRVIAHDQASLLGLFEAVIGATHQEGLLLRGTEGEPFANPRRRPRILHVREGRSVVLFEEEALPARGAASLPQRADAATTAQWITSAMNGQAPVPYPLVNQFACCLYVAGYTDEMNHAKAIAAVEAGRSRNGLRSRPGEERLDSMIRRVRSTP